MYKKPHILCIHYNGNSRGSFTDKSIRQYHELKKEYELTYMLAEEGNFTNLLRSEGADVIIHPLHEFDLNKVSTLSIAFEFRNLLKKKSIDLIYVMDFVNWRPTELITAKLTGVPTILFCAFYKSPTFEKSFLRQCSRVVTNSRATAMKIAGNKFDYKTDVIYNSVNPNRYTVRTEHRKDNLTLGFIGSLIPIKGIEDLLHAFREIRENSPITNLLIAGSDRDGTGYAKKLIQQCHDLNIQDQVEFVGHVDPVEFFQRIDMLAVPSHEEPFGYINIEAGASGIPVVATEVGGIPEIIIDGQTGLLFQPRDQQMLARKCIELASNPELRKKMGNNARMRIEEHFSHERCMPQWKDLFASLLGKSKNGKKLHLRSAEKSMSI